MNIDLDELRHLAAVQPRLDLYAGIHKALRAFMADTLLSLGRLDVQDEQALGRATAQVVELMELCVSHLGHENRFLHTAIEARAAGASAAVAHDHDEHLHHTAQLRAGALTLRGAAPAVRPALALALYRELAVFVAGNLLHMHVEETTHNAVLWERYTDAELAQVHDELIASIPPAEMLQTMRWLIPYLNPQERCGLLAEARGKLPSPAFDALLALARAHLAAAEWTQLARALDLPPVPGLVAA